MVQPAPLRLLRVQIWDRRIRFANLGLAVRGCRTAEGRFLYGTAILRAAVQKEGCFLYRRGLLEPPVQEKGCFLYGVPMEVGAASAGSSRSQG